MNLGAPDRFKSGPGGNDLANAVLAVQNGHGARIHDQFGLSHRVDHPRTDARHIPAQAHDAVRLMAPQIGLYEAVGNQMGVSDGKTDGRKDGINEGDQSDSGDGRCIHS